MKAENVNPSFEFCIPVAAQVLSIKKYFVMSGMAAFGLGFCLEIDIFSERFVGAF